MHSQRDKLLYVKQLLVLQGNCEVVLLVCRPAEDNGKVDSRLHHGAPFVRPRLSRVRAALL